MTMQALDADMRAAEQQLALTPAETPALRCPACRSRQTVVRSRADVTEQPFVECQACGRVYRVRLVEVRW